MTASSSGCTPLFLNEEPHSTGVELDLERRLADRRVSRSSGSPPPRGSARAARRRSRDLLEQVLARGLAASARSAGMSSMSMLLAEVVLVGDRLHVDDVDDPGSRPRRRSAAGPARVRAQAVDHRLDAALEVRADAVHLVDVGDARDVVLVGLAPHRLGLRLDAGDGVNSAMAPSARAASARPRP